MFREPENGYFALALVCIICIVSIGFVAITYSFSRGYLSSDQEHSANFAQHTQTEASYRECLRVSINLKSAKECVNKSDEVNREAERAEQDLSAQREMAQWAKGMLWATLGMGMLTFGASVVGVRYVYLTLIATQEMAQETKEIGSAQTRAHLMPVSFKLGHRRQGSDGRSSFYYSIGLSVKNVGSTPAYRVSSAVKINEVCGEWSKASPRDIGPGEVSEFRIMSANLPGKPDPEFILGVYVAFDSVFTQGNSDRKANRIRFDYLVLWNKNKGYDAERV